MKTAIKQTLSPTKGKEAVKGIFSDIATAVIAGIIVGFAYFFFQNSNGFAPGGVGGLATMTYHFLGYSFPWAVLMLLFNIPIFVLVSIFVNRKLGLFLILYMSVQSFSAELLEILGDADKVQEVLERRDAEDMNRFTEPAEPIEEDTEGDLSA